jgi:hypothetical protein
MIAADRFSLELLNLRLPSAPVLRSFQLEWNDAQVHRDPFRIPRGSSALVKVELTAESLRQYLEENRPPGLGAFEVKAEDGELTVIAVTRGLVPIQVGAKGTVRLEQGRLEFVPTRAEIAGMKAPDAMVREYVSKINPILDISKYDLEAQNVRITIQNGMITLECGLALLRDFTPAEYSSPNR